MTYFLQSARLGFREWSDADLDLAVGLWGDPAVVRLITATGALSEGQIQERLQAEIERARQYGVQYWPMFCLESDVHIGCCGLRPYKPHQQILELGVHIRSAVWRRGYAEESCRAVMKHAFAELGVKGLFAGHNPENDASRRLLSKLGFRNTHDEYYEPTGLQHPSYLLTREEFPRPSP